jgi:hypothetical protein
MRRALVFALVTLAAPLAGAGTVTCRDHTSDQAGPHACAEHDGIARQIAAPEGQADKAPATPRAQTSEVGVVPRRAPLPPVEPKK